MKACKTVRIRLRRKPFATRDHSVTPNANEYIVGVDEATASYNLATFAADYDLDAADKSVGGISSRDSARHLARMLTARENRDAAILKARNEFLSTAVYDVTKHDTNIHEHTKRKKPT